MTMTGDPWYVSVVVHLVGAGGTGTRLLGRWRRLGRRWLRLRLGLRTRRWFWWWLGLRGRRRVGLRGRRLRLGLRGRRLGTRTRRWRAVVEALVAAALQARRFLLANCGQNQNGFHTYRNIMYIYKNNTGFMHGS